MSLSTVHLVINEGQGVLDTVGARVLGALLHSQGAVGRAWSRHEAARRRSDMKYRIIHHKVNHTDQPSCAERSALERPDTRHSTLDTEGCQPI